MMCQVQASCRGLVHMAIAFTSEAIYTDIVCSINKFSKVFVTDVSTFYTLGHLRYLALPIF
jgi:hypothetical protein